MHDANFWNIFSDNMYVGVLGQHRIRPMEQCTLKNVSNNFNTNIYSYLETSGGQSSNLNLKVVLFFNTRVN